MKQHLFFALLILLIPARGVSAQSSDLKETFLEAESYFLFEEYNEALPLYLKIHRAAPENNNINYKIGICLLNDPYQKEKSIIYLERAIQDINPKYRENNFKETTAPPEAYFYLGNAYLVNNKIDKALENYKYFREILDEKVYDVELVEEQIRICNRARDLQQKPVDYDHINMSERINSRFADINPIVSEDGNHLVFVSKRQFYDATFYSEKVNGKWLPPRNIIPELEVDGDVYPTSLSGDGDTMIIYRNDDFIGNLYISRRENGHWTGLEKLGDDINTKYWESHGCLTEDGKTLYFTSNRKGGYGGLDIYRAEKQKDGSWSEPVNLGETVNTRYNEETPFITGNGQKLYFSSYGHYNMGGYDIFYTRKGADGKWDMPINLGYPINTTDDDLFYQPYNNGINAYMSKYLPGGFGRHDIYYLEIYSENNPRMYLVKGSIRSKTGPVTEEDSLSIYLVDRETADTVDIGKPDLVTQEFEMEAPQGEYNLIFASDNFRDLVKQFDIDDDTDKELGIVFDEPLELEPTVYQPLTLTGEESRIRTRDSVFNAEAGVPFSIKIRIKKGSTLYSTHYADTLPVAIDTMKPDRRRVELEIVPREGENRVELIMEEENGDRSYSQVVVRAPVKEEITTETPEMQSEMKPPAVEDRETPAEEDQEIMETGGKDSSEIRDVKPGGREGGEPMDSEKPEPEREMADDKGGKGLLIGGGLLLLAGGLILIIILFRRRRKSGEEEEE